ncbi:MAG: RNA methyltransferase [Bacteroidales bacterium]|nr:RNA methyltransferase [Bacteroidales bacterium]
MTHKLTTEEMGRMTVEEFRESEKLPLTVVLDNVRSQNNIGSVFRTADAFRVEHIALCGICSTPPHREIHKTALGAEDSVEWSYYEDTAEYLRTLKKQGYKIYAIEQVDDSIKLGECGNVLVHECDSADTKNTDIFRIAIILGNEIEGVQESLLPLCDGCLEIPQFGTKHSLNVSCAAAIVIWEIFKMFNPMTIMR